jgi:ADP-ribose pyrophosphatase
MKKFKILSRQTLIDSPYCPIEKQRVELPDKSQVDWWVQTSYGAVLVVPIMPDGRVLYQKNYKHGCGTFIFEFPAGMIDSGEDPLETAQRELREETGYRADRWVALGQNFSNPTGSTMRYFYFLALDCVLEGEPEREPAEQIELFWAKDLSAFEKKICQTPATSSATISALGYTRSYFSA